MSRKACDVLLVCLATPGQDLEDAIGEKKVMTAWGRVFNHNL